MMMYLEERLFLFELMNTIATKRAYRILCLCFLLASLTGFVQSENIKQEIDRGTNFNKSSKYDSALTVFENLEQGGGIMLEDELVINYQMASAYYYRGEYPLSIKRILRSIAVAEELKSDSLILLTKRFAGEIYRASDNPAISKKHLDEALVLAIEVDDKRSIAYCLNRLGVVAFIYKDNDLADSLFTLSMKLCKEHEFMKVFSMNLNDVGELYFNQGQPEKSLKIYQDALKLPLLLDIKINTLNNMANALWKMEQYDEAITAGLEAQHLADEANILTLGERAVRIIADCYMSQGNFEQGIIYYRKYMKYRGKLFTEQKDAQILELEKKYESERKQFLIDQQNSELALLAANNSFQQKLIIFISVFLILFFGLIYNYRSKRFAVKSKKLQETFSQQLLTYQEEERQKISRDLHDSIGQSLILIKNKVQLKDEETGDMIANTLEEVRAISKQLHPVLLEKLGLTASIEKLIEGVDKSSDVFIESDINKIDGIFEKEQELHIYRIVQETINNMIKHANAVSAAISVLDKSNLVQCVIEDRGQGFDLTQDTTQFQSLGMQTLKERTKILNGHLVIDSTVGKGTYIELTIPKPSGA